MEFRNLSSFQNLKMSGVSSEGGKSTWWNLLQTLSPLYLALRIQEMLGEIF